MGGGVSSSGDIEKTVEMHAEVVRKLWERVLRYEEAIGTRVRGFWFYFDIHFRLHMQSYTVRPRGHGPLSTPMNPTMTVGSYYGHTTSGSRLIGARQRVESCWKILLGKIYFGRLGEVRNINHTLFEMLTKLITVFRAIITHYVLIRFCCVALGFTTLTTSPFAEKWRYTVWWFTPSPVQPLQLPATLRPATSDMSRKVC